MHAHSTTIPGRPDRIEDGVALVNDDLLPSLTARGSRGVSLLVDPASGRCIATSSWDSEAAMRASYVHLQPIRQRLLKALGARSFEVREWEIAFFHRA